MSAAPLAGAPSVLTLLGHPDDAELWAGGTLAQHAKAGAAVTIAVLHTTPSGWPRPPKAPAASAPPSTRRPRACEQRQTAS